MGDSETIAPAGLDPTPELVYLILYYADGELTQSEITARTCRSQRVVRDALYTLEDEGLVSWRTDMTDTRRKVYSPDK